MIKRIKQWLKKTWLRFKKWFISLLVAIGLIAPVFLLAAPVDMSWTNAIQRTDGSVFDPVTEQQAINVYCDGDTSPTFVSPGFSEAFVANLSLGSHPCYLTTLDVFGLESVASSTKVFDVVPTSPPNAPDWN